MEFTYCGKQCKPGYFCDHGTHACETCHSICNPLRNTMDECRARPECTGYIVEERTTLTLPGSTSGSAGQQVNRDLILIIVIVFCIIFVAIVLNVVFRKRILSFIQSRCCSVVKKPVPISSQEQKSTWVYLDGGNPYIALPVLRTDIDNTTIAMKI